MRRPPVIEPNLETFLTSHLRTQDIAHSGRDLYEHLAGTHDLLQAWGNARPVCVAGLFHSIYGTWHFRHQAFPIDRRAVIRDLIGAEAERLVYIFCVAERPRMFLANAHRDAISLMDHSAKAVMAVSRAELDALLEIETANLIEQRGNIRRVLEDLSSTRISGGAKRAIAEYFAAEPQSHRGERRARVGA
jgi:PHD/YefM family antitoxin component YafN of YafNO toxin-antitoxin module